MPGMDGFEAIRCIRTDLNRAELQLGQLRLSEFLEPTTSYLSVIELGLYDSTTKVYKALADRGIEPHSEEWSREIRQTLQSLGSGFIIDPAGHIVTNQHVVERAADLKIHVTTNDGKTYNAHYIAGDDKTDLAFIKIDAQTDFPFINLDNISPNLLGETVIVVGNAVGYGSSISRGVLSAVKRNITVDETEYKDLVQTDAAINPGNSGGPVIDLSGRLVGIASAKMAFTPQGVPTQGLGFAIPADVVRDSVNRFKQIAMKQGKLKGSPAPAEPGSPRLEKLFGMQLQDLSS